MSVTLSWAMQITANETLETSVPAASAPVVVHDGFNSSGTLTGATGVPVTTPVYQTVALVAGAKTIDLTSLTGTNGAAIDLTGLKIQGFKIKNKNGNAAMVFTEGAANGYALAGAAWKLTLLADQEAMLYLANVSPDVAAADLAIDVTGTGTEEFEIAIVAG